MRKHPGHGEPLSPIEEDQRMSQSNDTKCACGCGQPTPPAKRAYPQLGIRKGEPTRYIQGHTSRRNPPPKYICAFCGKGFLGHKNNRNRFCSKACRGGWHPIREGMPNGVIGIPLTRGHVTLIDEADLSIVRRFKWSASGQGQRYAVTWINGKLVYMHRFLLELESELHGDHINGNGLDNRRSNLRSVTQTQNNQNTKPRKGQQYKGITPDGKRWRAQIRENGRYHDLGGYATAEEAARAYDDAARDYFQEFAKLNFPD